MSNNNAAVFHYNEMCPACGEEASGICDEKLLGVCDNCGAEISICSMCPGSCPERFMKGFNGDEDSDDICEYCDFYGVDCKSIDCGNCIAGRTTMTKDGRIMLLD